MRLHSQRICFAYARQQDSCNQRKNRGGTAGTAVGNRVGIANENGAGYAFGAVYGRAYSWGYSSKRTGAVRRVPAGGHKSTGACRQPLPGTMEGVYTMKTDRTAVEEKAYTV